MKYKKYFLVIFTFIYCFSIKAQNKNFEILFLENKFDEIIQLADSNITYKNKLSQDYFWKANALKNIGKNSQAISNLETAIKLFPTDIVLQEFLVNMYFEKGMYFYAKPIIDTLLLNDSTNFNLLSKKILLCEFNHKYNDAISIIKKQSLRDTTNEFFMLHLADNYYKINNIDSAIFYYNKAYKHNPNNIKTAYKIAKIYLKIDTKKALPICDSILKKDNLNIPFIKIKAYALKKLDRNKKALKSFENLTSLGDSSFSTLKHIGILRYKTRDSHNAKIIMEKALAIDSSDVDLTYFYGCALASDTIQYKLVNGEGETLTVMICKLSLDTINKNKEEACFYIKKSIDLLAPPITLSIIYDQLAGIYRDLKQYKKAINYYQLTYKNNPKKLNLLFYIANIYEVNLNDKKTALKKYQQFLNKIDKQESISVYKEITINRIRQLKENLFFAGELK
ncbi:MAG: tetratricopeptide repeat protein [Bacteroidetes bacterium]|nr:tetratricopeptide repeat protein [Bacteroidota bacterium]